MKSSILIAGLLTAAFSSAASAQTGFSGFSAGANFNLVGSSVKVGLGVEDLGSGSLDGIGKQSASVAAELAYGIQLGQQWFLAVGVDADLTKPKIGELEIQIGKNGGSVDVEQKSRYGLFVPPAMPSPSKPWFTEKFPTTA